VNPAEQIDKDIRDLIQPILGNSLIAAGKLAQVQDQGYWKQLGNGHSYARFKDYVESLGGYSYDYTTRLMNVARAIGNGAYTAAQVDEMGIFNAIRLLPLINKNKLTPEILHAALTKSSGQLEVMIKGDKAPKPIEYATCKGCGEEVKCQRCGERMAK
jgi:hypothetical protein